MDIDPSYALRQLVEGNLTARALVLKGADLRGVQLGGLRADGLDLEEADLRESSLTEVKWKGCVLREARLDAADFTEAVLRLCDLDQARATNATFVQMRLENSTARGARFDAADLTGAVLTDTDFSRASFCGANLEGVSASGTDFRGADLRGARMRNAVLVDSDLRGADLTGADLEGANLSGADLRGVVGYTAASTSQEGDWGNLPPQMRALTETMTPIVQEVLRTAGQQGVIDRETAERLVEEAAAGRRETPPETAPSPETMNAVSRVLDKMGNDALPVLIAALRQPNDSEPPPEVKAIILQFRQELGLDETASAEDILCRMTRESDRSPRD